MQKIAIIDHPTNDTCGYCYQCKTLADNLEADFILPEEMSKSYDYVFLHKTMGLIHQLLEYKKPITVYMEDPTYYINKREVEFINKTNAQVYSLKALQTDAFNCGINISNSHIVPPALNFIERPKKTVEKFTFYWSGHTLAYCHAFMGIMEDLVRVNSDFGPVNVCLMVNNPKEITLIPPIPCTIEHFNIERVWYRMNQSSIILSPRFPSYRHSLKFDGRRMWAGWANKPYCDCTSYSELLRLVKDEKYRETLGNSNRLYNEKYHDLSTYLSQWRNIITDGEL